MHSFKYVEYENNLDLMHTMAKSIVQFQLTTYLGTPLHTKKEPAEYFPKYLSDSSEYIMATFL
jgi:hypothetical protein